MSKTIIIFVKNLAHIRRITSSHSNNGFLKFLVIRSRYSQKSLKEFICQQSSIIRQKGESQNGCFKKTEHVKFFEKRTFLTPMIFSENLACFVFFKNPSWDSLFCLITDAMCNKCANLIQSIPSNYMLQKRS